MSPQASDLTPAALVARARAEMAQGAYLAAQTSALIAIADALVAEPEPVDAATLEPRISLDGDGTLDDFMAKDVRMVHFEAIDNSGWYATITLADGRTWQLNFGAIDTGYPGFARAERVE